MSAHLGVGLHEGVSERDYRADPCVAPSLNHSIAKVLLDQSPLHAWSAHPRLGNKVKDEPTSETDFGLACHSICLGKGAEVVIVDADNWQTKAAREARNDARAAGQIAILTRKDAEAVRLKDALEKGLKRFGLYEDFRAAKSEVVAIWHDGQVLCRACIDKLLIEEAKGHVRIFDLKTTESAKPAALQRQISNLHYDSQSVFYTGGVERLLPDFAGRVEFIFLFIESSYPYTLVPIKLNGEFRTIGASKIYRAQASWEACMAAGEWPEYSTEILTLPPIDWALNKEFGEKAILPPSPAPQVLSEGAQHAANSGESRARETVSS